MCNGNFHIKNSYFQGLTTARKGCFIFKITEHVRHFYCLGLCTAHERENDSSTELNRFDGNRLTHSIDETSKVHLNRNGVGSKTHLCL
jgi:hypothetical protein